MRFIADFHIHSHYSLATSKLLTPEHLDYWAKIKGVNLVGSGDFTHPKWTAELKEALEPAEEGLFKLKESLVLPDNPVKNRLMRFLLSAEISNIYKKNGKVRKIHNVVIAPDFQTVDKIQQKLIDRKFNISSDGRPILGLDSRDLLEMLLEINEDIIFIPAHIWTPWFAALGSKSGFDSIEECYGDLTKYIYAVETGLSSDQPLNWICSFLDKFTLLSNSDAHSPEKLGRNANIFDCDLSLPAIKKALKNQQSNDFVGTIDMFPQEGKYHFDGHRKCKVRFNPTETMEHSGICPVCGGKLTLGVAHRIAQLADRDDPLDRPIKKDFKYIIPLKEIIGEINGVGHNSKSVESHYFKLINSLGSELDILLNKDIDEIKKAGGEFLAVAIERMRKGQVNIEEGFDGQYGKIKLFDENEIKFYGSRNSLFDLEGEIKEKKKEQRPLLNFDVARFRQLKKQGKSVVSNSEIKSKNQEQQNAIEYENGNALIIAGPGTGKTYVLTERIVYLLKKGLKPTEILAITFSRQAASEIKKRIEAKTDATTAQNIRIQTFHSLGLDILKKINTQNFIVINDNDKEFIISKFVEKSKIKKYINQISLFKNTLQHDEDDSEFFEIFDKYNEYLNKNNLYDFDDLIYLMNEDLLEENDLDEFLNFKHILIDEFQDINQAQYDFLKLLKTEGNSFFAIGDQNQSIYGFRGSDVQIIDKFVDDFNAEILYLSKSYRCTDNILEASRNIVKAKNKISGINKGVKITITEHPTYKSEAEFVARTIEDMIGGLRFFSMDSNVSKGNEETDIRSLSDFAVLVRAKSLIPPIVKAFNDHSIPCQIVSNQSFTKEQPFQNILLYLKYLQNKQNEFLKSRIEKIFGEIPHSAENQTTEQLISNIWNKYFSKSDKNYDKDFQRFIEFAKDKNISEFIEYVDLITSQDDYNPNIEAVNIMTLHASKGLEFQCVIIPAIEDGIIPYKIFNKQSDEDEERRLLYVGMTRAKKYLFLSSARSRKINNLYYKFKRSPFIDDIEKDLLQIKKQNYKKKPNIDEPTIF